jgi:O-antigen/teichoic acid export membrane protein
LKTAFALKKMEKPEITLKEKTAKGLFWGGLSNGMQQVLQLAFGLFFARMLVQEDYGMIGVLAIFMGGAATLINSGFPTALVNIKNVTHQDYNAVFWFSSLTGIFLYIVLFFCAPLIARFFGHTELTALSRILSLGFLFAGFSVASSAFLHKNLMTKEQTLINIVSLLIGGMVGIVLVLKGFRYWGLAVQSVVYIALGAILRIIFAPWRPAFNFDFSPLKKMFSFSFKILLTSIFNIINANIFSVILGKWFSLSDAGNYNQGNKWMTMGYTFIGGMINFVTQPVLAQINDSKGRQLNVFRKLIRFGAFVSFPLMLGLAFAGEEFIVIAIGKKWLDAVPFLQLFCIWGAFGFLNTLYVNLVFTHGKSNVYMYITIACGLLQLLTIFLLYRFGIFPMLTGFIAMYFVGLFIWQHFANRLINLRLKHVMNDILPYLLITLACFTVTWLLTRNIQNIYLLLLLKALIPVTLYVVILKLLKSKIFAESLEFLRKIKPSAKE